MPDNQMPMGPGILSEDDKSATIRTADGQNAVVPKGGQFDGMLNSMRSQSQPAMSVNLQNPQVAPQDVQSIVKTGQPAIQSPQPPPVAPMDRSNVQQSPGFSTEQKIMDPEAKAKLNQIAHTEANAYIAKGQAEAAAASAQAAALQSQADSLKAANDATAMRDAQRKEAGDKLMADIQSTTDAYKSAKVDPNHYFGTMSTGSKFATSLGILMGGIGGGMNGTNHNLALDVVNKAIDRDLEAQKFNIQTLGQAAAEKRGAYATFLQQTGDERLADTAERSRLLQLYGKQLDSLAASSQNPIVQQNAKIQAAQVQSQVADLQAKLGGGIQQSIQLKPVPEEVQRLSDKSNKELQIIQDIRKLQSQASIGPIMGRIAQGQAKAGTISPENAELQAKLGELHILKATDATGNRPSAEALAKLLPGIPKVYQEPKTFNALLDAAERESQETLARYKKEYAGQGRLLNDPGLNGGSAADYQKLGFKPRK